MELIYLSLPIVCAAGTAISQSICPPGSSDTWRVKSISYLPNAALATDGTNYATVRPYTNQGTGTPIAAARTTNSTGGSAFVAHTVENVSLTGTPTQLEFTQADPLHIDVTHAGSGGAVNLMVLVVAEKCR